MAESKSVFTAEAAPRKLQPTIPLETLTNFLKAAGPYVLYSSPIHSSQLTEHS